jgi:hypothetical protein
MPDVEYTPDVAARNTMEALLTHPDVEAFRRHVEPVTYTSGDPRQVTYDVLFKDGETYRFEIQLLEAAR